jgi:choline dehydrogenase-like flavoprotein
MGGKMKRVIVVGSGAGGATAARELAINGFEIILLEKGITTETGNAYECYDNLDIDVELLKTSCLGGTTLVTAGNAVRTCQKEFKNMGIDLEEELQETEHELGVETLPDSHLGEGTRKMMNASSSLGLVMEKMPKFINSEKCIPCGQCVLGCPRSAKWTTLNYLEEAKNLGVQIIDNTEVTQITSRKGKVTGVKSFNHLFQADYVILSAGAIETPKLLIKAGLDAGKHLFVDTFVTVGGILKNIQFNKEVPMYSLLKGHDYILSPHYSAILAEKLKTNGFHEEDIMGIMVKIKDDRSGMVSEDNVIKNNTSRDAGILAEGSALAGAILTESGVDAKTLVSTPARGAHPGGTAAIGETVNINLETDIKGLFVADASVFPSAPGAPPILTIIALSKRLAKYLGSQ